ncbi:MAG: hypothetical protein ACR2FY_09795 [Pirellulaceae bacterium]
MNDQFGNRLDAVYASAQVEEKSGLFWKAINQGMTATGTYRDPVFSFTYKSTGLHRVQRTSAAAASWPTDPTEAITTFVQVQNIKVRIGGHELTTGIVGRKVTAEAPNKITVEWP